jgi:hypothetical protein
VRRGRGIESAPEEAFKHAKRLVQKAFGGLLETYVCLDDSSETIVHHLKKIANSDGRSKLVRELRNLEKKRLEPLDQMGKLAKST